MTTGRDERVRMLMSAQDVVASGLADRKLRILWGDYNPKVDLKSGTIFMPRLPENVSDELFTVSRGYLDHESAHAMFTDNDQAKGLDKKTFMILNSIEDGRINRLLGEHYLGCKINLEKARESCKKDMADALEKAGAVGETIPSLTRAMIALSFLSEGFDREKSLDMVHASEDEKVKELLDVIAPEVDQFTSCKSTADCKVLAKEVIKKWKKYMTEPPKPPAPPKPSKSDEDEDEGKGKGGKGTPGRGGKGRPSKDEDSSDEDEDEDEAPPPEEDEEEEAPSGDDEEEEEEEEAPGEDEEDEKDEEKDEEEDKKEDEDEEEKPSKDEDEGDGADEEEEEEEEEDGAGEEESGEDEEELDEGPAGAADPAEGDAEDEAPVERVAPPEEMEDLDDLVVTSETKVGKETKATSEHMGAEIETKDSGVTVTGEIMPLAEEAKKDDGISEEEFNRLMREAADKAERAMIGTILGQRVESKAGVECKAAAHSPTNYAALVDNDKELKVATSVNSSTDRMVHEASRRVGFVQTKLLLDLQDRGKEWVRDQEKGRLDANRLHRVACGDGRIFKHRVQRHAIDTAMMMLVDFSGSMGGTKIDLACQLAMIFSKACELLDIPNEVVGFTTDYAAHGKMEEMIRRAGATPASKYTRWEPLLHLIVKPFEKNFAQTKHAYANACGIGLANNVDGEAVLWAGRRLAQRREKTLRLLVLSDGYPCAGGCDPRAIRAHLKGAVKRVTGAGIECIGIGIQSAAVKDFYPESVVFNNLDELVSGGYAKLSQLFRKSAGVTRTGG